MKSSSYGLLTELALQVECLAPRQNFITCKICTKGKSLKEKERIHYSLILISYMETQEKLSKTYHLITLLFSLFLFSRFHGNFGLNQMVCMRHLIFLFMCDLILIEGKMKSFRYGLLTELAFQLKCLECAIYHQPLSFCASPSNQRLFLWFV